MRDAFRTGADEALSDGGAFVAVVGPSGVGKDSLIAYAQRQLADDDRLLFVRRVVTREGNSAEDHETMSLDDFVQAERDGRFAVTWEAHGLRYAIPAAVRNHLAQGGVAVANGSRAALDSIRSAFDHVEVVSITSRPEIIAERLAIRGRESATEITERLRRTASIPVYSNNAIKIDNSGDLAIAGQQLVAAIERLLQP